MGNVFFIFLDFYSLLVRSPQSDVLGGIFEFLLIGYLFFPTTRKCMEICAPSSSHRSQSPLMTLHSAITLRGECRVVECSPVEALALESRSRCLGHWKTLIVYTFCNLRRHVRFLSKTNLLSLLDWCVALSKLRTRSSCSHI